MDDRYLETLVDMTIDAMTELGEAEAKLASAQRRIEAVCNALYAEWSKK